MFSQSTPPPLPPLVLTSHKTHNYNGEPQEQDEGRCIGEVKEVGKGGG